MPSFTNILVPFDGSDAAKRALDAALGIAAENATVTMLQAADQPFAADPTAVVAERMAGVVRSEEETEKDIAAYWENVEASLTRIAEEARAESGKDVKMVTVAVEGSPAAAIVGYAEKNGVDIIVMGRRGLGSVRSMLGSVSQRVAHDTDLPLLLVK